MFRFPTSRFRVASFTGVEPQPPAEAESQAMGKVGFTTLEVRGGWLSVFRVLRFGGSGFQGSTVWGVGL